VQRLDLMLCSGNNHQLCRAVEVRAGLRATQLIWSVQSGVEFPLRALGNGQVQQRVGNSLADLNNRLFSSFTAREDDFV
jgi:hypothetical protein